MSLDDPRRRVVVTGLGGVTPLGPDVASTWAAALAGMSGAGHITSFDASALETRIGFGGQNASLIIGRFG